LISARIVLADGDQAAERTGDWFWGVLELLQLLGRSLATRRFGLCCLARACDDAVSTSSPVWRSPARRHRLGISRPTLVVVGRRPTGLGLLLGRREVVCTARRKARHSTMARAGDRRAGKGVIGKASARQTRHVLASSRGWTGFHGKAASQTTPWVKRRFRRRCCPKVSFPNRPLVLRPIHTGNEYDGVQGGFCSGQARRRVSR